MDSFKYFPLPWSAPEGEPEGAHCLDANGHMCLMIMWPVHPPEETEAVEQEAYRLMRLIPTLLNAAPKPAPPAALCDKLIISKHCLLPAGHENGCEWNLELEQAVRRAAERGREHKSQGGDS